MIEYATTWLQLKLDGLKSDRRGVTAMEYGLIAALVAVAIIAAVTSLGTQLASTFTKVTAALPKG